MAIVGNVPHVESDAVVVDSQRCAALRADKRKPNGFRAGVLLNVGQSLLGDPIQLRLDRERQRAYATRLERHADP